MRLVLPRLYVILDAALLSLPEQECAVSLADAGVRLVQYRNKAASTAKLFAAAQVLSPAMRERRVTFIVNDRADVAALSSASGVHVGQDDLSVEQARKVVGGDALVGVSTHNLNQFQAAAATSADYIAFGPIFATSSKANPDPVVGLDLLSKARQLTTKPVVAIGGITLERARGVIEAGADSVAVISDILRAEIPANRARQYIDLLEPIEHDSGKAHQTHG
ncbi:MAG TPA: thiamine phosphate synthase [Candidatus Acidoferrales bacterium]|nr:thiamine phosphate synthase [Candidatus Acidoferrales bacterium]